MAKFRKRPVVVEAVQWFPGVAIEGVTERAMGTYAYIRTLEGGRIVSIGDWVITGVAGEKYPCNPRIFEATYDPVAEQPETP